MTLNFNERRVKFFYVHVAQNKTLCVSYKFIPCDTLKNTIYINAAGCIMEHEYSACPKQKLRHTASSRLAIRPLRWQHTYKDGDHIAYFRRLHIENVVRANNCKGARNSSTIPTYFYQSASFYGPISIRSKVNYVASPVAAKTMFIPRLTNHE